MSAGRTGHVAWTANGEPVDVAFLHGFSDSGACWDPIVRALGGRWGTVVPDARGHGKSGLPDGPAGVGEQAGDAAAVLDALPVRAGGAVVVGHSMGAGTAIGLATERPDLVAGLVLEDPVLRSPGDPVRPVRDAGSLPSWLAELRRLELPERVARGRADNPAWPEDELGPWARSKGEFQAEFGARRTGAPPALERLLALSCPVLLLRGDPDRGSIVAPEAAETAAAAGHVRVVHVPGVGHSIRREDRERFLVELAAFLGAYARPGAAG